MSAIQIIVMYNCPRCGASDSLMLMLIDFVNITNGGKPTNSGRIFMQSL